MDITKIGCGKESECTNDGLGYHATMREAIICRDGPDSFPTIPLPPKD
jgi:hypothetical protein